MTGKEQMEELCKELREELRSGVIRGLGEGLARRGMSHAIFKRMGGPEVWARVSKGSESFEKFYDFFHALIKAQEKKAQAETYVKKSVTVKKIVVINGRKHEVESSKLEISHNKLS